MKFVIVLAGKAYDFDVGDTTPLDEICDDLIQGTGTAKNLDRWELRDRNGSRLMDMSKPVSSIEDHGSLMADLILQRTVAVGPDETVDILDSFGQVPLNRKIVLRKRLFMDQRILADIAIDERRNNETRARCEADIAKGLAELEKVGPQDHLTPDDLTYAATSRCKCGAGLASVQDGDSGSSWVCSVVLLTRKDDKEIHDGGFPYNMYSIKEEFQPSANGATTRPTPSVPA